MRALLVALTAAGAALAPVRAQSPEATLDRAVEAYSKVKTARATFTQTITNPLTETTTTSRGEMQQRIPGYIDVRFTEPAGDRIVADGKSVWVYLPSTNPGQVIKTRAGENGAGVPDVTAQFLDSPRERYNISEGGKEVVNGRSAHAVVLVPKDPSIPLTKATIWVDDADALVRQFETVDQSGLVRRVTIGKLTLNGKLDPNAFTFRPPKGVKVFDQSGAS